MTLSWNRFRFTPWTLLGYGWALVGVLSATGLFWLLRGYLDKAHDASLLYLPIVLACAVYYGFGPAALSAVLSILCWDFFFLKPLYTLEISTPQDVRVLVAFLLVAMITARLATRVRMQTQEAAILDERNRMARDIHDTLAQGLVGIVIQLQSVDVPNSAEESATHSPILQARLLAEECLEEARRSVKALRPGPLEQHDLANALQRTVTRMTHRLPIRCTVETAGTVYGLPPLVESHLLRIGQEAITNALRHARPEEIRVLLTYAPRHVQLRITDNGCGFDTEHSAVTDFGLTGMRERAVQIRADLTVQSDPGQGTTVEVTVPILATDITRHL